MSIGYACLAQAVPGTDIKKCLIKNASPGRLRELIGINLDALANMVEYNISNGIRLYRVSSDIIPFASSPVNTVPWAEEFKDRLILIGGRIKGSGMRVSMHPGQYTVLNSPDEKIAAAAAAELDYHALFLDSLGVDATNKIILHIGGVYGDKAVASARFVERFRALPENVRRRLVIENDDRSYNVGDVLEISRRSGIPVVFDNLHHLANPPAQVTPQAEWIRACAATWTPRDGRQKIHYSQSDPDRKPGAHSASINIDEFMDFYHSLAGETPDIMLEVKDKNVSARKCLLCVEQFDKLSELEKEWGRYKYLVLEHSQSHYQQIRELLKDKSAFPALAFFRLAQSALDLPLDRGSAINAASHVWGYFKDLADPAQKRRYMKALDAYAAGKGGLAAVKRGLYSLAEQHGQDYLLSSYYFLDPRAARTDQA